MAKPKRICIIPGCGKWRHGGGYCASHYARWRAHGDPLGGRKTAPAKRGEPLRWLKEHLHHDGEDCLLWPFSVGRTGRGQVWVDGALVYAARYVCEMVHGPAPSPEHEAAHSCGNGHLSCVNHRHIRWATPIENSADRIAHGRSMRGEASSRARLTADQVRTIREMRGVEPSSRLAERFGVSPSTIGMIWTRRTWAWLSE